MEADLGKSIWEGNSKWPQETLCSGAMEEGKFLGADGASASCSCTVGLQAPGSPSRLEVGVYVCVCACVPGPSGVCVILGMGCGLLVQRLQAAWAHGPSLHFCF